MPFYYIINPALNGYGAIDQLSSYYSSFSPICQNSPDALNTTYYTWNFPQS